MLKLLLLAVLLSQITPSEGGWGVIFRLIGRLILKLIRVIKSAGRVTPKISSTFRRISAIRIGKGIRKDLLMYKLDAIDGLMDEVGRPKLESNVNDADANNDGEISEQEWHPLWRKIEAEFEQAVRGRRSTDQYGTRAADQYATRTAAVDTE